MLVAGGSWIEVDESLSEQLLPADDEEGDDLSVTGSITSDLSSITSSSAASLNVGNYRYTYRTLSVGGASGRS